MADPVAVRSARSRPARSLLSQIVTDALIELTARLRATAERLRAGELEPDAALMLIEECAQLASEASSEVDERARAVLEPLPDLPGQLPLPAA
jgi:hypothetical protein